MPWWGYIIIWAIAIILAVIIEISTEGLTSIWFALAALISLILAVLQVSPIIQLIVFVAASILFILLSRPIVKKFMNKEIVRTNADKIVQMVGVVTKPILPNEIGEVKVNSELWRAISFDSEVINEGDKVIINSFSGNKLLVSKIENSKERARLKSIVNLIKPVGVGVIIRTEAEGQSEADIQEDLEILLEKWNDWPKISMQPKNRICHVLK